MSNRLISSDSPAAISSLESAAGNTPCNSPVGRKIGRCGPAVAHASHSPLRGRVGKKKTQDICGPIFDDSSPSAVLQRSLANKLRQKLDTNGSPEYVLTWREWDTQSGPPICVLQAKARPTSDNGFIGWPTPRTQTGGAESRQRKQELGRKSSGGGDLLSVARMLISGGTTTSAYSRMGRGAGLNPDLSRWLMGFPAEWLKSVDWEMLSSRKSRRSSSKHS